MFEKISKEGIDFMKKALDRNQKKRATAKQLLDHKFITKLDDIKEDEVCDCGHCTSDALQNIQ